MTESVSPEHAAGIPLTFTCVTFPELSTVRVALSDETPQEVTAAFPAERAFEPRARLAAAPQAANVAATASAVPRIFARSFMSIRILQSRCCGTERRRQRPARNFVRRYGAGR